MYLNAGEKPLVESYEVHLLYLTFEVLVLYLSISILHLEGKILYFLLHYIYLTEVNMNTSYYYINKALLFPRRKFTSYLAVCKVIYKINKNEPKLYQLQHLSDEQMNASINRIQ